MWYFLKLVFGSLCFFNAVESLTFVNKQFQRPNLQVQTKSGIVQGVRLKSEAHKNGYYYAFMGIPYAKPPIGPLRFRGPKWVDNWSGILDGSREGSGCVEIYFRTKTLSDIGGTEDCLFLNVFTRNNPKKSRRLKPVMVFIYGGAFIEGSSDVTHYGPDLLVSRDVVVVTLNYRVGIFGFLSTEDLASPGNYGLKDQNLALRWVQKNIENFGGNPDSVTIFGQSAGSVAVHFHILSPKSRGLFNRAILESGSVLCHWGSQSRPRNLAYLLGVANGITNPRNSEELIERLRKVDLEDLKISILGATLAILGTATLFGLPNAPSIEVEHDEAFISKDLWFEMLRNGDFNKVPIMIGTTQDESLFFHRVLRVIKPFLVAYDLDPSFATPPAMNITDPNTASEVGKIVTKYYLGPEGSFEKSDYKSLIQFTTHDYFIRPIRKTALLMANYTPVYFYYFSHEGILGGNGIHDEARHPEFRGVAHGEEIYYLFNKADNLSRRKSDQLVRERLLTLWTNFAKYGNPTPEKKELLENVIWPPVSPLDEPQMKFLEINETLTIRHSFKEQKYLDWWEDMFKKYARPPLRTY